MERTLPYILWHLQLLENHRKTCVSLYKHTKTGLINMPFSYDEFRWNRKKSLRTHPPHFTYTMSLDNSHSLKYYIFESMFNTYYSNMSAYYCLIPDSINFFSFSTAKFYTAITTIIFAES